MFNKPANLIFPLHIDMWSALIKRVQGAKRKFASDEKFKMQIDELVSIMVFTRVEMKAAGLFNIDLSVITSVSDDNVVNDYFSTYNSMNRSSHPSQPIWSFSFNLKCQKKATATRPLTKICSNLSVECLLAINLENFQESLP